MASTKVTAAQRKHGLASIETAFNNKKAAIQAEFQNKAENRMVSIPTAIYPTIQETLRAMMGLETTAVLKDTPENLVAKYSNNRMNSMAIYPSEFTKPLNQDKIDEAIEASEQIGQRRRQEVDARIILMSAAFNRARDFIVLSDSGDEIFQEIQSFVEKEF